VKRGRGDYAAQKQEDCQIASQAGHKKSSRKLGKVVRGPEEMQKRAGVGASC